MVVIETKSQIIEMDAHEVAAGQANSSGPATLGKQTQ